jgi:predicted GH43/DUF377 family glycosyl hydrolase
LLIGLSLFFLSPLSAQSTPSSPDDVLDVTVAVPEGQPVQIAASIWDGWENYQDFYQVVQMAVDDYGSIQGFDVAVNAYDGPCDTAGGQALADDIVAETQNLGLVGPLCSSTTLSAAPVLETNSVVMISYANTRPDLYSYGPTIFNRVVLADPLFEAWDVQVHSLPPVMDWETDASTALGHAPGSFMVYAYDATTLLLSQIDSVSTVDGGGNLVIDRAALAQAVRNTDGFAGLTGEVTLNPFGDRLDTFVTWQDHFNGSILADEWSWVREDPTLWSLTDRPGWLELTTHQGGLGDSPNLSKNLLVQEAPAGDYRIVTRLDFDPDENYQLAGLLVHLDDDNYLLFGRAFCENGIDCVGNGIYFDFVEEGVFQGNFSMTTAIPPESTYLAITKVGLDYSGWISPNGIYWEFVGTHTTSQPFDQIGLGTTNGNQPTTGIPAGFDFFLLDNPARSSSGAWDGRAVQKPVVIKEGSVYKMWYEGIDYDWVSRVGFATSLDGLNWTTYLNNPVMDRGPAEWETSGEIAPFVMFHEGQYKMWYEGSNGTVRQLGYAASPDGIVWTKYGENPVLQAGPDAFDQVGAAHGTILYEDSTYKLWYHALADANIVIAYATSPDGVNWTKQGPVMYIEAGSWEDWGIWGPSVLKVGDTYWMWYAGGAYTGPAIGVATSLDGITWEKHPDNPVVSMPDHEIGDPTVLQDGEIFKMWFNSFTDGQIYYTESEDGMVWEPPTSVFSPPESRLYLPTMSKP